MTHTPRNIFVAIAFSLIGTVALSQTAKDAAISQLAADGYSRIEVRPGLLQTQIEATRGQEKRELVIDNITGDVVKSETNRVRASEDRTLGVSTRSRHGDDTSESSRGRDDREDDDHGSKGDDDGPDHDAGDDHGAAGDHGHEGGDDHGGEDGGHGEAGGDHGGDDGGEGSDHD